MKQFIIGQRWISESEPELGLGVIVEVEAKTVTCFFPAAKVDRRYGTQTAPLRRIKFVQGDEIKAQDGTSFILENTTEAQGIVTYHGEGKTLSESLLADTLSFSKPEERLFAGNIDSNELFKLRYDVLLNQRKLFISPIRGFSGPRLNIIPHQMYVANEVTKRSRPRVLLADEVGLGKTIEAGLILHQLILTGRVERCLILVPDSLVYQWFVEMLKKFQMTFTTINHDSKLERGDRPFEDGQLFVASLKYLMKEDWLLEQAVDSKWDLLVVDEAHQLRWSPDNASMEYDFVAAIAAGTPGVLLLSGTPEILGLAGHYARLHLLDPNRFHDFNQFVEETTGYKPITDLANKLIKGSALTANDKKLLKEKVGVDVEDKEKALQMLVDRHGTGRVYFRNTRKTMASYQEFFPKRVFNSYPIKIGKTKNPEKKLFEQKAQWLAEFAEKHRDDKTLLICHDKEVVIDLEKALKDKTTAKVAFFHSGMNLMNRDRQAAYFADPEGAQILLSTEIGSEGRNFEFARHLILFDLPKLPDLLEQRIGRLDRIGQKNDIQIHVPYVEGSADELLMRWYHEGFNAFESSPRGGTELYATVRPELVELLQETEEGTFPEKKFAAFLDKTQSIHQDIEKKLEEGQDQLVEINSFNHNKAMEFVKELKAMDDSNDLRDFMINLFNQLGVDVEDMNDPYTFFIRPGDNMYLPHFPGLESEGMQITFKRANALLKDDTTFLTWDHPMVIGIMDFISSKEMGNSTIASWKTPSKEPFLFEGYFLLNCVTEKKLQIEKWFPPTPLRVLLDSKMQDATQKMPKKFIDENVEPLDAEKRAQLKELPKDFIKECIKRGKELCIARAKQYKEKFKDDMMKHMNAEIERLEALRKVNPTVSETEILLLKHNREKMVKAMDKAELSLDSLRIVIN
ncbi:RNA polymerase-associated protein RapA [Peredibacter starrii]|uniref:RNA polymerase-associated protein RapA n=1 Tax=Peredibacter starrii TaxID=28202 RepID=A0AAX4HS01_9BACT|nr:RNA polymerase-associated protein RapA [Peredibacter starrii]WPU66007.1 RNA polymerase-associated protein RapA [Peredibacter starrii]